MTSPRSRTGLVGRLVPVVFLGAALAVWLAACGGGESAPGEEEQVRAALEDAFLTDEPAACDELYTQRILEQTTGRRGAAALRHCRRNADGKPDAESLRVTKLSVNDRRARATVSLKGGQIDGARLTIELVRSPNWKLDRLTDASLRRLIAAGLRAVFIDEGASRKASACVAREVAFDLSQRQLRRLMRDPSVLVEPLGVAQRKCGVA